MVAGLNCKVNVIRWIESSDDEVGGVYPSGTYIHTSIDATIEEELTDPTFIQQGIQTKKTFSGMLWGHNLQVLENDDLEVVSPPNHRYFGKRFSVEDARYDSRHPAIKQSYLLVRLTRSQVAHREVFQ